MEHYLVRTKPGLFQHDTYLISSELKSSVYPTLVTTMSIEVSRCQRSNTAHTPDEDTTRDGNVTVAIGGLQGHLGLNAENKGSACQKQ